MSIAKQPGPHGNMLFGMFVLLGCVTYAILSLDRGWIPHDEGQLGHTAERILRGELPHRDFVEPYTGGLGFLNAAVFTYFGASCEALRWTMVPFFVAFLTTTYWIALRSTTRGVAALVTLLCSCLTLPIYAAGMPSWYNLFFAVYGTAALLRHLDTSRTRWLVLAGVCGGCSILIKITGLYFVAAGLLFLACRQQHLGTNDERSSPAYSVLASILLAVFATLGCMFLRTTNPVMNVIHFLLPWWALTGFVAWNEWRGNRGRSQVRLLLAARLVLPFLLGVAGVVGLLVVGYAAAGALPELYQGLFVLPQARLEHARLPFPGANWLVMALPVAGLLALGFRESAPLTRWTQLAAAIGLLALLTVSHTERGYVAIYQGLRHQLPIAVLAAVGVLVWATRQGRLSLARRQELFLLAAVTLFVSLIQYPYAGGAYFFYAAPLGVLTLVFVVQSQPRAPKPIFFSLLGFVVLFLVLRMHDPGPTISGGPYRPQTTVDRPGLDRCNLIMRTEDSRVYKAVVSAVQAHSGPSSYIYAGPDCPELYFLADRANPTKTLYDFFEHGMSDRTAVILQLIDTHQITVAVIKRGSEFSADFSADLLNDLRTRFDHLEIYYSGQGAQRRERFRVLWRDPLHASTSARQRNRRQICNPSVIGAPKCSEEIGVKSLEEWRLRTRDRTALRNA